MSDGYAVLRLCVCGSPLAGGKGYGLALLDKA